MAKPGSPCSATTSRSNGRDVLEPIDSKGNVLLGDHGNLDAASHVETLRTHPVLGVLFNQRGGLGPAALPPCDLEGSQDWAAAQG